MLASEFVQRLRQVEPAIAGHSYEEALRTAIGLFRGAVARIFDRQVDAQGIRWPERKSNPPNPMLIRTGAMYDAATGQDGTVEEVSRNRAFAGISDQRIFYAKFHQRGTRRMARRQFFYLPKRDLPEVRRPVAREFKRILIRTMRGGE